jgi:hypothetical protein
MLDGLFEPRDYQACAHCSRGETMDELYVICSRGVMKPQAACRKFHYNPLKRIPSRQAELKTVNDADLKL